jgi:hypothetical protein
VNCYTPLFQHPMMPETRSFPSPRYSVTRRPRYATSSPSWDRGILEAQSPLPHQIHDTTWPSNLATTELLSLRFSHLPLHAGPPDMSALSNSPAPLYAPCYRRDTLGLYNYGDPYDDGKSYLDIAAISPAPGLAFTRPLSTAFLAQPLLTAS